MGATITSFFSWLQELFRTVRPWIIVLPWEQGVRVRLGKHVKLLLPGPHPKIPVIDSVGVLPTRKRMLSVPMQTVMTRNNKAVSVAVAFQYQIHDDLSRSH